MTKTATSIIAWAAAAAALLAAPAAHAEAMCIDGNKICVIINLPATSGGTVAFRLQTGIAGTTHFNMRFDGQQSELPASFMTLHGGDGSITAEGWMSAETTLPRTLLKISVQYCFQRGSTAQCAPWSDFRLPGPWIATASDDAGHFGWATGKYSRGEAEAAALSHCKGCELTNLGAGNCFAYARSTINPAIGSSSIAARLLTAQSRALNACSKRAPEGCEIHRARCIQ